MQDGGLRENAGQGAAACHTRSVVEVPVHSLVYICGGELKGRVPGEKPLLHVQAGAPVALPGQGTAVGSACMVGLNLDIAQTSLSCQVGRRACPRSPGRRRRHQRMVPARHWGDTARLQCYNYRKVLRKQCPSQEQFPALKLRAPEKPALHAHEGAPAALAGQGAT